MQSAKGDAVSTNSWVDATTPSLSGSQASGSSCGSSPAMAAAKTMTLRADQDVWHVTRSPHPPSDPLQMRDQLVPALGITRSKVARSSPRAAPHQPRPARKFRCRRTCPVQRVEPFTPWEVDHSRTTSPLFSVIKRPDPLLEVNALWAAPRCCLLPPTRSTDSARLCPNFLF